MRTRCLTLGLMDLQDKAKIEKIYWEIALGGGQL